jgi:hypothetical protein
LERQPQGSLAGRQQQQQQDAAQRSRMLLLLLLLLLLHAAWHSKGRGGVMVVLSTSSRQQEVSDPFLQVGQGVGYASLPASWCCRSSWGLSTTSSCVSSTCTAAVIIRTAVCVPCQRPTGSLCLQQQFQAFSLLVFCLARIRAAGYVSCPTCVDGIGICSAQHPLDAGVLRC